ncbi:MAG: polysaccharide biosynthesis tyrosine autokinase [Verrucomicrobiota bacterium]
MNYPNYGAYSQQSSVGNDYGVNPTTLHFNDYMKILRNRIGIILTIFLLTTITGYVVTFHYLKKIYASTAQVSILKKDRDIEVFKGSDTYFDPVYFQSQIELLRSKEILYKVIKDLDLQKSWGKELYQTDFTLPMDQAYDLFRLKKMEVDVKRGTYVIEILVYSEKSEEAAKVANTVAETYINWRKNEETFKYQRGLDNLSQQVEKQRDEVKKTREKVEDLRKTYGLDIMPGTSKDQQLNDAELQRKTTRLDELKSDMIARKVRYDQLESLPVEKLIDTLPALGLEDSNLTSIRQSQLSVEAEVSKIKNSGLGEDHPRVQSMEAQAKKLREQVDSLVEGKRKALAIDLKVSEAKVDQLEQEVKALTETVRTERSAKLAPFIEAQNESDRQQNILDALEVRYRQEKAETKIEGDPVKMISPASPSEVPVKPRRALNMAASVLIGLAMGIMVAFFIEYLDTSVKTLSDVEKFLGLPVLAVIPRGVKPLNKVGEDPDYTESYRILRAKMNLEDPTIHGSAITVLSGGPGEGKSTTLFNLAVVCAQAGQRVALIDADLRRPAVHKNARIENGAGLADLVQDNSIDPLSLIYSTPIQNLFIMPAGELPSESLGAFNAVRLRQILTSLKSTYDLVLIDSPPILGVSDGSTIAREVDQIVLVIQHRRYPRDISLRAKKAIEEVNPKITGVVLNNVAIQSDDAYYYYSSYTSYGKKKKKKSSNKPDTTGSHESKNSDRF